MIFHYLKFDRRIFKKYQATLRSKDACGDSTYPKLKLFLNMKYFVDSYQGFRVVWRLLTLWALCPGTVCADTELTNWKGGIDVVWGGAKGTAYQEEYWFHDKLANDTKSVWIKDDTTITFGHNDRNVASINGSRNKTVIGASGGGQVRYKIDGLWQELLWTPNWEGKGTLYPGYSAPFTLASTGVVGVTGYNATGKYWQGMVDSAGDEWHVMMYADDDSNFSGFPGTDGFDDSWASDGKYVLFCVNPKTPAMTVRVSGSGQFYTTPAWTYWVPKIHDQTTYFQGSCTIELKNIYGGDIAYRINGGSAVAVGAATVTLKETHFTNGSNTLEYWYDSTPSVKRTRTIVKNPIHPGIPESHGERVLGGADGWAKFQTRAARNPYKPLVDKAKSTSASGQADWAANGRKGLRFGGQNWPHRNNHSGHNAILAKYLGWETYASGAAASKTYAAYAKEMLLESPLAQHPVGFETSFWASMSIPAADTIYRGYWDSGFAYNAAATYDILMGGYRSDQVAGGITAIEDYYLRDMLASWVHLAGLHLGGFVSEGSGMWTACRGIGATMIACVMPNYSTPYYGTSGMDGVTNTVYKWAPYQTNNYTWKTLFFDCDNSLHGIGVGPSVAFGLEGTVESGALIRPPGTSSVWIDKTAYASWGQCGQNIAAYASLVAKYGDLKKHPNLMEFINQVTAGTLKGGKGGGGETAGVTTTRVHMITLLNPNFPQAAANATAWIKSLPSKDGNSEAAVIGDAGISVIAAYDDSYYGISPLLPTKPNGLRIESPLPKP